MYEFWYDYVKPRHGEKAELSCMDTDSFRVYIKIEVFHTDMEKDVGARFDTSNYELDKPLPKGTNKRVIGLMKDEIGRKINKEFTALRAKTYSYLTDNIDEDKKTKGTKNCVKKRKLKSEDY